MSCYIKMRYSTFIFYCIITSVFKSALLLFVGYYYGKAYTQIAYYIGELGAVVSTLAVFAVVLVFMKYNPLNKKSLPSRDKN